MLLAVLSRWLLRDALWHPRTDQAPDGHGFLVSEPLNDAMELGASLNGRYLLRHGHLLKSPPKVHIQSTRSEGSKAVLVGTAARSGTGYTPPI